MTTLVVGFSKRKGFAPLSWVIMLCEGTKFSHTFIHVYADSIERDLIYQATGSGVHFVGRKAFDECAEVIESYPIQISEEDKKKLLQWSVDNAGKPYGYWQIVGLGLIRLAKLIGLRIKNPFSNGDKAYVCCELVVAALKHLGMKGPDQLDQVDLKAAKRMVLRSLNLRG